ncbi:zf-HC2 domain-containing protein [Macrococcus equi]|uniref:zf-HC2 domain-containing protein n=1 Tax=Macrococcus equi TaxID=3395462 RepID=UPI0039BE2D0E
MNHSIFQDLLPNYIDGLTSEETNMLMEEHMNQCESCRAFYLMMKEESAEMNEVINNNEVREFDAFKKVKKSNTRKIIWAILGTSFVAVLLFGLYTYLYSTQWITKSTDVEISKVVKGNVARIHIKAKNSGHYALPSEEFYVKSKGKREYIIYESRKGFKDLPILSEGFNINTRFIDNNTIINSENKEEKIDDKDVIVLRFKDKRIEYKLKDLIKVDK